MAHIPKRLTPPDRRSTAAKRQARYRERLRWRREHDDTVYPRKRCKNCPKFFRQRRPTKVFCSEQCRKEFHRFGSSYGQLKAHLEGKLIPRLVEQATARDFAELIHAFGLEVTALRASLVDHAIRIARLEERLEESLVEMAIKKAPGISPGQIP